MKGVNPMAELWLSDNGSHMCGEVRMEIIEETKEYSPLNGPSPLALRFDSFQELESLLKFFNLRPEDCQIISKVKW